MDEAPRSGRFGIYRSILTALVLAATFVYLTLALGRQWRELRQHEWTVRWDLCVLSFVMAGGWFAGRALLWQRVLRYFGHALSYKEAFRMWALSELGRYLPGKVWYALGRGYLAAERGVSASIAVTGMALELLIVLLGAMLFCAAAMGTHSEALRPLRFAWPLALALTLVVAHPRVLGALLRLARREPPRQLPSLPQVLVLLLISVALWLVMGSAFVVFASSLTPVSPAEWPVVASSYAASWSIGLVTVVAPAGLGVRESALNALLSPVVPSGGALVVALAARVWVTLAEGCCALVALWAGRR